MKKKVNVDITINMDIDVPEDWDNEMIEFWANDGTYCASNLIDKIIELDKEKGCICQNTKLKCTKVEN